MDQLNNMLDKASPEEEELIAQLNPNRTARRRTIREVKRLTKHPRACLQMYHPMLDHLLTPHGAKVIAERRVKGKAAKQARKANRGR